MKDTEAGLCAAWRKPMAGAQAVQAGGVRLVSRGRRHVIRSGMDLPAGSYGVMEILFMFSNSTGKAALSSVCRPSNSLP